MSLNTKVYIGTYVKARCSYQIRYSDKSFCSKNPSHLIIQGSNFCHKCGGKLTAKGKELTKRIFYDVFDPIDGERGERLGSYFTQIDPSAINADDDYDYLLVNDNVITIDVDSEGVHQLTSEELLKVLKPTDEVELTKMLTLLQQALGYTSTEVLHGVMVSWCQSHDDLLFK